MSEMKPIPCGLTQQKQLKGSGNLEAHESNGGTQFERTEYLEVLHRFALSQAKLDSLEDIVWNIAKTAIAELGFEDCVVYLLDDDGETLVQRAAHGPKNPVAKDIDNLITIPVGQGIVGSVALTGQVELVGDTSADPRYIVDDANRLSELAVPIIHDGRVIGVLDSEHREKNFFSAEHVKLFTTIASLASTRIDTAIAMERLKATIAKLEATESTLASQAEDLRKANYRAEQASRAKSQFLANMSHEIRTPMTAIIGYGDLLARLDAKDEDRRAWVRQLKANSSHLLGVVGDVLDLSRIESGSLVADITRVDTAELLQSIDELMRRRAESKGLAFAIRVEGTVPEFLETDTVRLRQALLNLISNAIKYTDNGYVLLTASSFEDADRGIQFMRFDVSDTGIGIAAEDQARLFSPFERVHDYKKRRDVDGTGLGLAISKGFAELLGGDIAVNSRLGEGSTFSIHVVVGEPGQYRTVGSKELEARRAPEDDEEPTAAALSGRCIAVCEDSPAIAELLRCLLVSAGADVELYGNGEEIVNSLACRPETRSLPDLLVMDMQMPIMDGYEATRAIRKSGFAGPIVALTAFSMAEDRDRCLRAGCDHYMQKPINTKTFLSDLQNILQGTPLT